MRIFYIFLLCLPWRLQAQEDTTFKTSVQDILRLPTQHEEDEVTTASRNAQKVSDVPASVTIITRADIERFGYKSLEDILKNVTGMYSYFHWQATEKVKFGIRGYLGSIVFMVNRDIIEGEISMIPIEMIDRIEIIKGPMAVIYGNNAFFGAINIITNESKARNNKSLVTASVASENTSRFVARVQSANKDFRFDFNASYFKTDGFDIPFSKLGIDSVMSLPQNRKMVANGTTKRMFRQERKILSGSLQYKGLYANFYSVDLVQGFPSFQGTPPLIGAEPYDEALYMLATIGYRRDLTKWLTTDTRINSSTKKRTNHEDFAVYYGDYGKEYSNQTLIRFEQNVFLRPHSKFDALLGFQYISSPKFELMTDFPADGNFRYQHLIQSPVRTIGLLAQLTYRIRDNLQVVAGVRYEKRYSFNDIRQWFDAQNNFYSAIDTLDNAQSSVIPRFALVWSINPQHNVKLLYGEAVQQSGILEAMAIFGGKKPNLIPQKIVTYEANYSYVPNPKLAVRFNLYHNQFSNLIVRVNALVNGTYRVTLSNSGKTYAYGAECGVSYRLLENVDIQASLAYQKTREQSYYQEIDASFSPKILGNVLANYRPKKGFIFGLIGNYVGEMESTWNPSLRNRNDPSSERGRVAMRVNAYFLLGFNIRLEDKLIERSFLNFNVTNALNQDVFYASSRDLAFSALDGSPLYQRGIMSSGRYLMLTLGYKF